jgi:MFS family permease
LLASPLLPIFLTVLVDVLGLTIVLPLLPFYAEDFGATAFQVTLVTASYGACQLISAPILGRLSDRVGRKPVLLVSQIGTCLGFLLLARVGEVAAWLGVPGLALVFAGRIIDGATAGNLAIAQAYISDVTRPEARTRAFALIGISFGVGFLVGPGASGLIAARYGHAAPFFVAAALSLTSVLTTATLLPRSILRVDAANAPRRGFRSLISQAGPRRYLGEFLCFHLSFATLVGGLALFLQRRNGFDVRATGGVFTLSGVVGLVIQGGIVRRGIQRGGEGKLALLGFGAMATGYAVLALEASKALLVVAVVIAGVGTALVRPCLTTLLTKHVTKEEQGAALGVSSSLASFSTLLAHPVAGLLIDRGMLTVWACVAAAAAAVGVAVRVLPAPPPVADAQPDPPLSEPAA